MKKKLIVTSIILFLTIAAFVWYRNYNTKVDEIESKVIGDYILKDSHVILVLFPFHQFHFEGRISDKYYGDGNWDIYYDLKTNSHLLNFDFENGENLEFEISNDKLISIKSDSNLVFNKIPTVIKE